jgi:hypothetical protein
LDETGNSASVEVRDSEGTMDASGIVVVAGDVSQDEYTRVACSASIPQVVPGKLDSWVRCSAADDSDVAPNAGRASDIDEVRMDSDGGLVVG